MDFDLTDDQKALQDTLARFIEKDYAFDTRKAILKDPKGYSAEKWKQLADLGLLALPFPEAHGGLNGTPVDTMLVMQLLGRGLVVEPYLSTVILCGGLINDAGSEAQKTAILPAIAEGKLTLALAHYERGGRYELSAVTSTARPEGGGYVLNGAKGVVLNGETADKLIVTARTSGKAGDADGISLFLVDRTAPGVIVRGYRTQDGSRAAEVELANVAAAKDALIGAEGKGLAIIEKALDVANAALCAETVGIMTAVNDTTLEYLKTRKQFGQAIGKFQALQHRMADMVVWAEQAKSMMMLAAVKASDKNAAERSRAIAGARAYVSQASRFVGQNAVQLHGGMGVTDEMQVAHYFKRLTMIAAQFGDADWHMARFSDTLAV
jgi:alkylation response protein AidB-like acyl-CoA dehydrogenase